MGPFEKWIRRLGVMGGPKRKTIYGTLAAVLGDENRRRAILAGNESAPLLAQDPQSIAYLADDRQLDVDPAVDWRVTAQRLPAWLQLWKRAAQVGGMLLAIQGAGFPGAVLVQTNGYAWSLAAPAATPPAGTISVDIGDATWVVWRTAMGTSKLVVIDGEPQPWCTFDSNKALTDRYAVLFPGGYQTIGRAFFDNTDAAIATFNHICTDLTYRVMVGVPTVTDGAGGVYVAADLTTKTIQSVQIVASAPWTGYVDVLAFEPASNPLADVPAVDLARLRSVIDRWAPASRICQQIIFVATGRVWGWPVCKFGAAGKFGGNSTVRYSGVV